MKVKHPLSDFEYDVEMIAKRFIEHPHEGRSYDWWRPSSRPPWREGVWQDESGVMLTRFRDEDPHPVYLLSSDIEIEVWRFLFERARPLLEDLSREPFLGTPSVTKRAIECLS